MIFRNFSNLKTALRFFSVGCLFFIAESSCLSASDVNGGAEGGRKLRTQRLMHLTGNADFSNDRSAWDKTYNRKDYVFGKEPEKFLVDHVNKLPKGRVLDIAMGEGRHAVYLAKIGRAHV